MTHAHRFTPSPDGRLFGKPRFRNHCACGAWQTPRRHERGLACRRCGFPTVAEITDPANPLHPCCAEPDLMALGARSRRTR
jgi:hypothetical protein